MKNVIITASLVTNLFLGLIAYSFASGKIEHNNPDYLTTIASKR